MAGRPNPLIHLPMPQRMGIPFRLNKHSLQARGLVGWWPTVGQKNVSLRDYSGYGNHASPVGSSITYSNSPVVGAMVSGDATNDEYLAINASQYDGLFGNSQWAFTYWVKATFAGNYAHFGAFDSGSNTPLIYAWSQSGNNIRLRIRDDSGTDYDLASSSNVLLDNEWQQIVCVRDEPSMSIYHNGRQVASYGSHTTGTISTDRQAWFARVISSISLEFPGDIADTRIYNRAPSAAEVYQLYAPKTRWELYEPIIPQFWSVGTAAAPAGRTTYNTDPYGLGIGRGLTRTYKQPGKGITA